MQVVKDFWFYDEHFTLGTVFIIEEEHVLHDFKDFCSKGISAIGGLQFV